MNYHRITSIEDPHFAALHSLLGRIFPPEEVLAYERWKEPLEDPGIHVYVAVDGEEVVGSTEYRYYPELRVAMTDFTIIGDHSRGIGRFLMRNRENDLRRLAEQSGTEPIGMFAEIYDPYSSDEQHSFGGVTPMNPFVRREVLSHMGYKRLAVEYVHPSWDHEGQAVEGLNLSFLPADEDRTHIPAELVTRFLEGYYSALPNKPQAWLDMMDRLRGMEQIELLPI
ncbi:GNAT family N-acetyltransferase [Paenibacillus sp. NEAU-GSW1]|uniref:GNAT family N-acetyltransferase n=1 Tax=Paenibacillus sp. NEAU-GSW1 TaxID=2682486 RepID=UPI0012E0FF89|nr:GNAT family N-acetyltransferase [Paenibacillus sp. NEAU-GSW1]MUT67348.1 GNAT family N-acetyltransferase [Paenibacillus sp. NEAU-GSW1]